MPNSQVYKEGAVATTLRWVFVFGVLAIIWLACYGFMAAFLVAEAYASTFDHIGYVTAGVFGAIILAVGLVIDPKTGQKPAYLPFAIFAPVMAYAGYVSVVMGGPAAMSLIAASQPGSAVFKVIDARVSHRRCPDGIKVASDTFRGGEICGLDHDFRLRLKQGEEVELIGRVSQFGLRYDRIHRKER